MKREIVESACFFGITITMKFNNKREHNKSKERIGTLHSLGKVANLTNEKPPK